MKALLSDDIDAMNYYMNQIIMTTFSYFDIGQNEPERFYHGLFWDSLRIRLISMRFGRTEKVVLDVMT